MRIKSGLMYCISGERARGHCRTFDSPRCGAAASLPACLPATRCWVGVPIVVPGKQKNGAMQKKAPWFPTRQICVCQAFCPTSEN